MRISARSFQHLRCGSDELFTAYRSAIGDSLKLHFVHTFVARMVGRRLARERVFRHLIHLHGRALNMDTHGQFPTPERRGLVQEM